MNLPGAGDESTDGADDLHRFVVKFRPTIIIIQATFGLVFVAVQVWPLAALFMLIAALHFCMMRWDARHANQLANLTPWMWLLYLAQFVFSVLLIGPAPGFQYYMMATIPALFSSRQWPLAAKLFQTILIALFLIACDVEFPSWKPVYPLPTHTANLLREVNVIGTCAMMAVVSYLLSWTVKQAEHKLKSLAATDALTGLLNRRRMTESINKEHAHCSRVYRPLSVIICDIDHFKLINDRYGHDGGDQVLKEVARIFRSLRDYDSVARWGGEEFIVLLPDADLHVAMKVAERIRAGVAEALIPIGAVPVAVTMTLGVAQIHQGESWQAALARADQALYQGKEGGRNRAVAAADT